MFDISLNGQNVSILMVLATIKKGKLIEHPSGASCYKGRHGTAVGTWTDGHFSLIRWY